MLILVLTFVLMGVAPAAALAPEDDPSVGAAQEDLRNAEAAYADVGARLDRLAQDFEQARAHADRLVGELDDSELSLAVAEADVVAARQAREAQIRAAYKEPGVNLLRASGAFLLAPDASTALHASAVMTQVATARASDANVVLIAGQQVAENIRNQRDIAAGSHAAMGDLANLSAVFSEALDVAAEEVEQAEITLADAEELARQQAIVERAPGLSRFVPPAVVRQVTTFGGTQPMTCPLGQPNGFIDSWGFARSGGRSHQGVDMFATYGMHVLATTNGIISRIGNGGLGGLSIDLVDALGNRYYYAHLSATYVVAGQSVAVGELIAANGNSGNAISTPPHVHWQFHPAGGAPINPYPLAAALCR